MIGDDVVQARTQIGGMSPGCAARLLTRTGRTAFLKAVGVEPNADTARLFRHEITVLSVLPVAPYRPELIATYDDGEWVGLLLRDVEGRYPDLGREDDARMVWDTVSRQSRELTPPPPDLDVASVAATARRWLVSWSTAVVEDPFRYLPAWAASRVSDLNTRVATLPDRLPSQTLCHWDIRDDNLLLCPDGTVVVVDWGLARPGPSWGDLLKLASHWVESPYFDVLVAEEVPDADLVTDFLVLFGARLTWLARQPAPPGLPTITAFRAREAARMLAGARRRLGRHRV